MARQVTHHRTPEFRALLAEVFAGLKLRFDVFNLELGEGLQTSFLTGRDMDEFDEQCHHLIDGTETGDRVVGTYRCKPVKWFEPEGFYSNVEFELSKLPPEVLGDSIELPCVCRAGSPEHGCAVVRPRSLMHN
jgi:putative hemolysin